jgi:hypothetical protein
MPAKAQGNGAVADTAKTGEVTAPNAFQMLIRKMSAMAELEAAQGSASGIDIIPILEAETEEEMWDADERPTYNAKTLSGCELQIYGFSVKFGTGGDDTDITTPFIDSKSRQMYLLIEAARINKAGEKKEVRLPEVGEVFSWNTSARNIVGKMFWMLEHGWFDEGARPVQLRIEGTPLGGKKSVEKLKPLTPVTVGGRASQPDDAPF